MTVLTEWALTSGLLILAITALRALLGKRIGAELRYALWAVVLVRLLIPVQLFDFPVPATRAEPDVPPAAETAITGIVPAAPGSTAGEPAAADPTPDGAAAGYGNTPAPSASKAAPLSARQAAGWLWLAGAAAMAAAFVISNISFARRLNRVRVLLANIDYPLPVYAVPGLPSPCLFGLSWPAIYVTGAAAADPVMLRHVLAHEYTHYRHGDHVWNVLRAAALTLHWWNPLVWLAAALSRRDCELACDEGALRRLGGEERFAYGRTLLALLAEKSRPAELLACATTMTGGRKNMQERVTRIARTPKRRLWAAAAVVLAAAVACIFAFGSVKEGEKDRGFDSARSFSHTRRVTMGAETPDTVYFVSFGEAFLKYVDKASGVSGFLCGKPECRHQTKDCNAYLGVTVYDVFIDGGRLYWVANPVGESRTCLFSAALDGTDRREELVLSRDFLPGSYSFYGYTLHGGCLYYYTVSNEIVDGKDMHYNYIVSFPLDSGREPFVILKEEIPYYYYCGTVNAQFYGDFLYILSTQQTAFVEAGENPPFDLRLRRWNPETGGMETLYEEEGGPLYDTNDMWVTDDAVYFNRNTPYSEQGTVETRIYRYDFAAGTCEFCFDTGADQGNMAMIADGLVSGSARTINEDGSVDLYVVLKDFDGNVLVDDTYTLELAGEFTNRISVSLLGRDEGYAYYYCSGDLAHTDPDGAHPYGGTITSIISVALDGSGARVMGTEMEYSAYHNGGITF